MNNIILSGTVLSIEKSHEIYGEKFYKVILSSERASGNCDELICVVPECYKESFVEGCKSAFHGDIRTRNIYDGDIRHVETYVVVDEIKGFCRGFFRNLLFDKKVTGYYQEKQQ